MKNFKTVMFYTIRENVRKKSFIISNIFMIAMVVLMFNVPSIMKAMQANDVNKILIIDQENIFAGTLSALNEFELGYDFTVSDKEVSQAALNEMINNEEYVASAIITLQENNINFDYTSKDIGKGIAPEVLKEVLAKLYFNIELNKLGLSEKQLAALNAEITYEATTTKGEEQPEFSASIVILSIALFFAIYFYAFQVSAAVTLEKTSKVMETLVTSTNPRSIILGKTIGTALLGIAQFVVMVLISVVSYKIFMPADNPLTWLDFSNITPLALTISFIYFILGYALFAFLYALVGSTVSKPEDIQTANAPVAMISLFGFYFGYFTVLFSPTSSLTKIASLTPFSAPFSMPFRMIMVNVPMSEVIWSIIILILTILLVIHISIKIYSLAVLHYGSKITFKDMVKMYKQK